MRPGVPVTPGTLGRCFFILTLYARDKGVTRDYFADVVGKAFEAMAINEGLKTEARFTEVVRTDEQNALVSDAIRLSVQELKVLRDQLWGKYQAMKLIPEPEVTRH